MQCAACFSWLGPVDVLLFKWTTPGIEEREEVEVVEGLPSGLHSNSTPSPTSSLAQSQPAMR